MTRSFVLTAAGGGRRAVVSDGVAEEVSQLTPELLKEGAWRTKRFRKYTISLRAPRIAAGKRHPYREFLDLVKLKLVSMGFQEMRGRSWRPSFGTWTRCSCPNSIRLATFMMCIL